MEDRPSRGRGGSWRRGGRGGHDSDSHGGEHRGRGRGGHHRGRGKRDHYRGRGRGGGAHAAPAEFHHRGQDEADHFQEEGEDRKETFSRRKLESNWDRYAESEKAEPEEDTPTQRGTDFQVLLETAAGDQASCSLPFLTPFTSRTSEQSRTAAAAAESVPATLLKEKGDSFTQFRFSEEKDWELDSFGLNQMSDIFVDLPALAQLLQQVPLHQRLNVEAELLQVSISAETPAATIPQKLETLHMSTFPPLSLASKVSSLNLRVPVLSRPTPGPGSNISAAAESLPEDSVDEELDQLLSLQKPVQVDSGTRTVREDEEERAAPQEACEGVKEAVPEVMEEKTKEAKNKDVTPPQAASVRQEVTEEDLEDWLDSMIS